MLQAVIFFCTIIYSVQGTIGNVRNLAPRRSCLMSANYPLSIKNVISKLTSSTQTALREQISRMEIELPPGADFGLELTRKRKGGIRSELSMTDKIKASNRDASRLIVEMFSSINLPTVVLFPTSDEAREARDLWAPAYRGQVLSIETPKLKGYGKLRSRRFTAEEQEQVIII